MSGPSRAAKELEDLREAAGRAADRIENLTYALQLKVSDSIHLEGIRGALPDILRELRAALPDEEEP